MASRRSALVLPGVAILAFAIFLGFALLRLFLVEQDMRDNVDENMLWVTTQAQVASHRFDQALSRRALVSGDQDPELRFDILVSRLRLMDDGPQRRYLRQVDLEAPLDSTLTHLDAIDALLAAGSPGAARRVAIQTELDPLMATLNRIATGVMKEEWESTGARLDTYRTSLIQVIASVVGILICGLLLIGLLILALRQRRAAQRALMQARDHLEDAVAHRTRELETERQRVVTAIETAPDGFAAFDALGRLQLTNPKLGELLPLPVETPPTLDALLTHIRQRASREEPTAQTVDQAPDDEMQCDLELNDEGWRQLTVRPTPEGGHVLRVADITRYKAAASTLERSLQRERGVSEFYRSFAAMVSHQFRTPLAVIDSGLQRLQRRHRRFTEEQRDERYARLREAVAQMTRLVESSLTAARLDGHQVEARPACHSLAAIVDHLCRLQAEAGGNDRLAAQHASPAALAWCDRALTEQVLANLVSNALKYSPASQRVEITTLREGDRALCRVRDSGPGIPRVEQDRLFERFFRGRTASGTEGIGLGLNIARHLARIQQGDLEVSSRPGEGTTFTLRLPAAPEESADDQH